jgi:tRNA-2-methylthio-N6-dimethylallyladenosine synthase
MKRAYIKTFGCQMNVHDSEKMAGVLRSEGYDITDDQKEADIIIFNTCSIRQKAEQKFLSELGRTKSIKKHRPELKIAVAGCIAQQMGSDIFKRVPHVDYVFGPQNIHALGELVNERTGIAVEENPHISEMEIPVIRKEKSRAWVSIMYGCDNFCSYCIVPYTRGRETSRPSGDIAEEIRMLAEEGYREVTLLGQNVNSYRSDTGFPGLLHKINGIDGIERIRFVTSHPRDLSESLMDAMVGLDKVCEHIHLPMQSGSTRILSAMNRGYSYGDYIARIEKLRERIPDIAITSDIIAGFPSESKGDHKKTLKALREIRFDGVFAFKYSPRPGTVAATLEGQLKEGVKLNRLRQILSLQDDITLEKNKVLEDEIMDILVDGTSETDDSRLAGRTRANKIVNFKGSPALTGKFINVRIIKARRHSLDGEPLSSGADKKAQ